MLPFIFAINNAFRYLCIRYSSVSEATKHCSALYIFVRRRINRENTK